MKAYFHVEASNLKEIEDALGPKAKDKAKVVLKAAINNAAKQIDKQMINETKKKYRYHRGQSGGVANTVEDLKRANTVQKAKVKDMTAVVEVKGAVNELLGFRVSPMIYVPGGGYPEWYKASARRGESMKKVALRPGAAGDKYKGFIVKYKSGHYALAQRVPGKKMRSNPHKEAIKSLLSISEPKAEEIVYRDEIQKDIHDILQRNIQEQIRRFTGGGS